MDADFHIFKGTVRTKTPAIMSLKWMIETFEPNNGIFERDSEGPCRFLRGTCVKNYTETISRSEYLQIAVRQESKLVQTLMSQCRLKKKVGFLSV